MRVPATAESTHLNGHTIGERDEEPVAAELREAMSGGPTSDRKEILSNFNTPQGTAADVAKLSKTPATNPSLGGPITVETSGAFPRVGSILGPYFSVGNLGKGTFCSIHKCINMHYYHDSQPFNGVKEGSKVRLAAAKVEIGEFRNSGVLGGEAAMLQFLDSSLPENTVPKYLGHFRAGEEISAIVMEYLPGQDMHWIRDWATKYKSRRISVRDAVYLTADVMLPLLQRMHEVGIVHRDVKPSNCVKRGLKDFCMVDFGLSKSVVVPSDSAFSDPDHPFSGKHWIRPPNYSGHGNFRKERPTADFRGTSMYASVRVHQRKDYCPRDDMWSLLYVFCDLVSGGLPWMSHAANRDREACQKLKERIHGEGDGALDQTEKLLWGHEYHMANFKRNKGGIDPPEGEKADGPTLPEPLELSRDTKKVELLRKAFSHLATLTFTDKPDYNLVKSCLVGFLEGDTMDESTTPIDWERLAESTSKKPRNNPVLGENVPTWELEGLDDPVDSALFQEAELKAAVEPEVSLSGEAGDIARLPLELQFRIAQLEYNLRNYSTIRPHLALRDWMKTTLLLLNIEWDSQKFERGGHRSNDDGYRREFYLKLVEKCMKYAAKFKYFRQRECIYDLNTIDDSGVERPLPKKRRILDTTKQSATEAIGTELLSISQTFFRLRAAKRSEEKKTRAPPPRLSFG